MRTGIFLGLSFALLGGAGASCGASGDSAGSVADGGAGGEGGGAGTGGQSPGAGGGGGGHRAGSGGSGAPAGSAGASVGGAGAGGAGGQSPEAGPEAAPDSDADGAMEASADGAGDGAEAAPDGAAPDGAGAADADASAPTGPVRVALPCGDTLADVYVTPKGLPPLTVAARGDVVRCALDGTLDQPTVQAQLDGKALLDVPVSTALSLVRIAYRTERADGVDGVGTARVYLPTTPRPAPLHVIVIAHPSVGTASTCAPSKDPSSLQDFALPWAARGYAVIAPDYAGLGNEGVQGYLDNRDSAHSVLDAARALRKLLAPGWLSPKIAIFGHSQGGGAALSAQAIASSYGSGGEVSAVAVFAPEWPTRLNSFGFVDLMRMPQTPTIFSQITKPVVTELLAYAYASNNGVDFTTLLPQGKASGMKSSADSQCLLAFGAYVQFAAPLLGDLLSDPLRTSFLACVDKSGGQGCDEPGKSLYAYMQKNFVKSDHAGAPVLYVQGLLDTIMPPAEEAACNIAKLLQDGVNPQVCTDPTSLHTDVVPNNIVFAMKWAEAVLGGSLPPSCDGSNLPACTP